MSRTIEKALAHLTEEKNAILAADFAKLGQLADGTRDLVTKIGHDPELARALKEPAERNRTLLQHALKGVERAKQETNALVRVQQTFGSYGKDGQLQQHVGPASKIQRSF